MIDDDLDDMGLTASNQSMHTGSHRHNRSIEQSSLLNQEANFDLTPVDVTRSMPPKMNTTQNAFEPNFVMSAN